MNNLPKVIILRQFPSITAYGEDYEEEGKENVANIARQYLQKLPCFPGANKTFGLKDKDGKFYIGNKER